MREIFAVITVVIIAIFMTWIDSATQVDRSVQKNNGKRVSFASRVETRTISSIDNQMENKYGADNIDE